MHLAQSRPPDWLSGAILNCEQELVAIQEQIRNGFADPDANMIDIIQLADSAARIKSSVTKYSHNRGSVVARYVLYIAQDPLEFETQSDEPRAADISHMQIIGHCRLAQLGAMIREKRLAISTHKQLLESVVTDWKSCVDEIVRLGVLIAADEQVMKESEEEHVTEFSRLFQFSRQVRDAARKMMNSCSN